MNKYFVILFCLVSGVANAAPFGLKEIYDGLNLPERTIGWVTETGEPTAWEKALDYSWALKCSKFLNEGRTRYACGINFSEMTQNDLKKIYDALPAPASKLLGNRNNRSAGGLSCTEYIRDYKKQIVEYSCLLNVVED